MPVTINDLTAATIRKRFLDFFREKNHKIVPSGPIVLKDDPTLMFANAGMNQFKDVFLGHKDPDFPRVADTQKCLRVSGKHNDLEEVGRDAYHHTMFEMLGNWSFGDYFKEEAIQWAWELLTEVYDIPEDRLYVTVFEGDQDDDLSYDKETHQLWKEIVPEERILWFGKEENFWEMGDTGPCGPCSEIHIDIREETERKKEDAANLVNQDHPQVIELWNLVFMEFNRQQDGSLTTLPQKHVDTGMGFERLVMALQGKAGTYNTDLFAPLIKFVEEKADIQYGEEEEQDMATRVIVDHIRAISFAIADGQLPYREGPGYVIRRILRRAVRFGYSYLDFKEPFLHEMVPILVKQFEDVFPEIKEQQALIKKVLQQEENTFLNTLDEGLNRLNTIEQELQKQDKSTIDGQKAFELYDTYGFPIDLTRLIAEERGLKVDEKGFEKEMKKQQQRARKATEVEATDWTEVHSNGESEFVGYDQLETEARLLKYRSVKPKDQEFYQLVLDQTPFYPESGGQAGDKGVLKGNGEEIPVIDTQKEYDQIVHLTKKLPDNPEKPLQARVDTRKRKLAAKNHSATHLLHAVLRQILGTHVEQKGSYLDHHYLRFDFTHFEPVDNETLQEIEQKVNQKIRANIPLEEKRDISYEEAINMGALALFGEQYGEKVRVIAFDKDFSCELCGGTHVGATGEIGLFKITNETGVAAGVRRIEAITGPEAEEHFQKSVEELRQIRELVKNPKSARQGVENLVEENKQQSRQLDQLIKKQAQLLKSQLKEQAETINGIRLIAQKLDGIDSETMKTLAQELQQEEDDLVLIIGTQQENKALLHAAISQKLVDQNGLNAGNIISELAQEIKGGGGGQPHFAQAGGSDPSGLDRVMKRAREMIKQSTS